MCYFTVPTSIVSVFNWRNRTIWRLFLFQNPERRAGYECTAVVITSNTHTGLEMAKAYESFKLFMR